ncbi:hypothetical protein Taro_050746 [Colocasia esculenta]|uniref:Glycosyltransferase n=1 Tax=Colocasia esculenta TaxID=4460 RepID=A0A843XE66_COLES|nr:hypothetical protein [Colocasia esculenta]
MGPEAHNLEVFFFPFLAPGHMIPAVDMARLFASRGVKATVVTTRGNASLVQPAIDWANKSGRHMRLLLMPFPSSEAGLPEGCENVASVPAELQFKFMITSTPLLRDPLERLIREHQPDCIISDGFFPWTADVALGFGIPRIVFDGTNFFSNCVTHSLQYHAPSERLAEGETTFVVPGLPHRIELLKTQTPDMRAMPEAADFLRQLEESELRSFGMVVNSFYELEPEYADHYRNAMGRKAWHVGPVSLCREDTADEATRGAESSIDVADCLNWLDSKKPSSVLYVSFGSISLFTSVQLREIALALEASNLPFIWVVRDFGDSAGHEEEWLPEGFRNKVSENNSGLVIRGWAPQVLILNHGAVGAFVTHCGWNSCLEAISAGVPLVTWPLSGEQFYNERQMTEVLQIGTAVGAGAWTRRAEERELIKAEQIEKVVSRVIGGGEEAEGKRRKARELARRARRAMEEGGSSYSDMDRLIDELIEERRKIANQSVGDK